MLYKKEKVENITPLQDFVKVEVKIPKEVKTDSGIILQTKAAADNYFDGVETYHGKVLAVSENASSMIKDKVSENDVVVFDRLAGYGVPTEGDHYVKLIPISSLIMKKDENQSMEQATPLHERVVVKVEEGSKTTESGIYVGDANLSSNVDSDTIPGVVVNCADGVTNVVPGDRIRFDAFSGIDFEEKDATYKVLSKYDILAKI